MAGLIILTALVIAFNFFNGFQGSSSVAATIVASRAMHPRMAVWITAIGVLLGPFLFGTAVAQTIGAGIVAPGTVTVEVIIAALSGAVLWNLLTWLLSIPSSPSHSLIGGLVGAVTSAVGMGAVISSGVIKVLLALFFAPMAGFVVGFLFTRLVFKLAEDAPLKINVWFQRGQILAGGALALAQGANDGQKAIGIMTLGLVSAGYLSRFEILTWVVMISAASMSLGALLGSWRLIKTLGGRFFRIRIVDGFCSEVSAGIVIITAGLLGGPVSTTQVVSSSILGVGAAERPNKVRWNLAGNIGMTWLLTIPANFLLAWAIYRLIDLAR